MRVPYIFYLFQDYMLDSAACFDFILKPIPNTQKALSLS
jgi:hypothetical protein